jgi:hypothetical protein
MLPGSQLRCNLRHPRHQVLDYLLAAGAGAVAGVAFLSSAFAALLATGFLASSLATTGASALVTAGVATGAVGLAGAVDLAGSAAKADTANKVTTVAISDFILISFGLEFMQELISCMYIQRDSLILR